MARVAIGTERQHRYNIAGRSQSIYLPTSTILKEPSMSTQFDNVSVVKQANLYFDGKCVSHTIIFPDASKKTIGVIFPSLLKFNTGAPEIMELNAGTCNIRLQGEDTWATYTAGQTFNVPGNSSFDIETVETLDYVCHFA